MSEVSNKFCINCIHYRREDITGSFGLDKCSHPKVVSINYVNGKVTLPDAFSERLDYLGRCKREGILFSPLKPVDYDPGEPSTVWPDDHQEARNV